MAISSCGDNLPRGQNDSALLLISTLVGAYRETHRLYGAIIRMPKQWFIKAIVNRIRQEFSKDFLQFSNSIFLMVSF
jgi:hypothetical protein